MTFIFTAYFDFGRQSSEGRAQILLFFEVQLYDCGGF